MYHSGGSGDPEPGNPTLPTANPQVDGSTDSPVPSSQTTTEATGTGDVGEPQISTNAPAATPTATVTPTRSPITRTTTLSTTTTTRNATG